MDIKKEILNLEISGSLCDVSLNKNLFPRNDFCFRNSSVSASYPEDLFEIASVIEVESSKQLHKLTVGF